MKSPLRFRAVKTTPRPPNHFGPLSIEADRSGSWTAGLSGLTADDVQRIFTNLTGKGCQIVDTDHFQFKKKEEIKDGKTSREQAA